MRGKTQKVTKNPKLRRPAELSGSSLHGGNTSPNLASTIGARTSDPDASHIAFGSAGQPPTADPLVHLHVDEDETFYRTNYDDRFPDAEAAAALEPLPDEGNVRAKLRAEYEKQARESGAVITPSMAGVLHGIIEDRIALAKAGKVIAKQGSFRINRRTGLIKHQTLYREFIIPLENSLRLNTRLFLDEIERQRGNGRRGTGANGAPLFEGRFPFAVDVEAEQTPEGVMATINEFNLILGKAEQSPEQVQEEYERMKVEANHG